VRLGLKRPVGQQNDRLNQPLSAADKTSMLFDLVAGFVLGSLGSWPGDGRRPEDPYEQTTGLVGVLALPMMAFCLVLFAGVVDPMLALIAIPPVCVALATGLCLLLRTAGTWTARTALGSGVMSFVACGCAWLMAIFVTFFKSF